jgi:anti-sigma factor RsiW
MKHLPYEAWVFEDGPLSPGDAEELQIHLERCEHCSGLAAAMNEVTHHLTSAPTMAPAPGFTARWRARLETKRAKAGRRNLNLVVVFITIGLVVLNAVIGSELIPFITPIAAEVFEWAGNAINIIARVNLVREILSVLVDNFFSAIPLGYRLALPTALAALSVVWFISIQKLGYIPVRRK